MILTETTPGAEGKKENTKSLVRRENVCTEWMRQIIIRKKKIIFRILRHVTAIKGNEKNLKKIWNQGEKKV